jgi:outer membrane murein-binding lipoprotein Lpp
MSKPSFGFTYPTVTGENPTAAFRRVLSEFPGMQLWSHYYSGEALPAWTEAWFAEAPADCVFLISVKATNVTAIGNRIAVMPEHLRGRVLIFLHHEPDQWRSASDPRSDPSPLVWLQRQVDFASLRAGAPWRLWVQHWVCFTEDRMRTDWAAWDQNWGDTIQAEPRIDGVAADCFNIGRSIVREGADIFAKPLEFARREGRPLIIREFGQVVPVDTALDSQAVADQIRENWAYAKTQYDADGVLIGVVWYYNHNNVLIDPSGTRPGRPLTRVALEEIMADARMPDDDPSPCCAEVDALTAQVAALEVQVGTLQAQVDAHPAQLQAAREEGQAEGRAEAFDEIITWAEAQTQTA